MSVFHTFLDFCGNSLTTVIYFFNNFLLHFRYFILTHLQLLSFIPVIKVIQASVKSETIGLGDPDLLLKTILRQIRLVVLNAAQTALLTSQVDGNIDANSLADKGRE